jgi:nucleoside-diphosphate-sugar epimerase
MSSDILFYVHTQMLTHVPPTRMLHVPPVNPDRVLVLGATGFIGRRLADCLDAAAVPCVRVGSADLDLSGRDARARLLTLIQPGDAVVFLSAITRDRGRDVATMMRNLAMGQAVAEALDERPCAHLVYLSSDAAYGDTAPNPITEATPCNPDDLYGVMHLARERMLADVAFRRDLPLLIIRPTMVYGGGDTHGSYGPNRFVRTARADSRVTLFGGGEEIRDFVHVDDVAEALRLALASRCVGVLNVATGVATRFSEVAAAVRRLAGSGVTVEGTGRVQPLRHRYFDVSALRAAFPDFAPRSLESGLIEALRSIA